FVLFKTKAVVLATGGVGKCWKITSNSWEYTGDGQALGLDAGADLIDMEFVQFHPTGMVWPPGVRGLLVTEAVRGEGGILKNAAGERFMERYDPERMELSTRDLVAKAIYYENKAGKGTPHGGVWLDISHRPAEYILSKLPGMYHQFKDLADVDITKEPMEVGPTMHYMMGGIKVDPDTGASTLPGLYAAGECSGGMHGANRLGGNTLSDLLVFGRRAGIGAAEFARANAEPPGFDTGQIAAAERDLLEPFERSSGESPYEVQFALQDVMENRVGIMRTAEDLTVAVESFPALWERWRRARVEGSRLFNPGWHLYWDLRNMLMVGESVARSALQREESRGGHTRVDFPETDGTTWERLTSIVRRQNGEMLVETEPKPEMPDELRALIAKPTAQPVS
ncbi:MAG: FAD-binding protein, partial [Dehalococcoidia bacterium]